VQLYKFGAIIPANDEHAAPNAICAEFVVEDFRVVVSVGSETERAAGVAPGDLRADPCIVLCHNRQWIPMTYDVSTLANVVSFGGRTR